MGVTVKLIPIKSYNLYWICVNLKGTLVRLITITVLSTHPLAAQSIFKDYSDESNRSVHDNPSPSFNISKYDPKAYSYTEPILLGAIKSYQLFISPSKGTYCPMYPSCSNYGFQAFEKYNPIKALILSSDRLHRCGHDLDKYETIVVNEYIRFVDLVEYKPKLDFSKIRLTGLKPIETLNLGGIFSSSDSDTASKNIYGNDIQIYNFADRLRAEGDFHRAITEYKRLISYYPQSVYSDMARFSLMNSYFLIGEYLEVIHIGQAILNMKLSTLDYSEINYVIGSSYFNIGNFNLAREYFSSIGNNREEIQIDKSLLLIGVTYANEENWDKAIHTFRKVNEDSQYHSEADNFRLLSLEGSNLTRKSRLTAGTLALVPGLGYFYTGYKQTAISAFLVNSLFFWATNEAFKKDNTSLGVMLGVLSFGWYTGNIYGSVISATRSNLKVRNDLLLKFEMNF